MAVFYPTCDKCGGNVIRDGTDRKCLQCGKEWQSRAQKKEFYNSHQDEILVDFKKLSWVKAAAKWQLSTSTLASLLKRWGVRKPFVHTDPPDPQTTGGFPNLPQWRDDWAPEVQLKWLHVYEMVISHSLKEVKV